MRSIARQSARLASSSRVRQPSRPRHAPAQHHVRSFSRTVQHSIDTRGPNGEHEPSTPAEQRQDDQKSQVEDAAKSAKQNETKSTEEEPKSAVAKTRRTRIQNAKDQKPPKPPPVPDWFLNHNVKLVTESVKPNREAKSAQVLRCVDKDTGHTLFTVPYYEAWPVPGLPGRPTEEHKSDKETARKKSLDNSFFDNKFTSTQAKPASSKARSSALITPPSEEAENEVNPHSLLRWALLEAETGIRAGFTVAGQVPSALNAASRVDISLNCPDSDSHEQMDDIVEDLANLTHSDIIRLDANDFADLTADYVGGGEDLPGSFSSLGYDVFDGYTANQAGYRRAAEEDMYDEDEEDEADEEDEMHRDGSSGRSRTLDDLRRALYARRFDLAKAFQKINVTTIPIGIAPESKTRPTGDPASSPFRAARSSDGPEYDRRRLIDLLDNLLEAPKLKQASAASYVDGLNNRLANASAGRDSKQGMTTSDRSYQALWRPWRSSPGCWYPDVAGIIASRVNRTASDKDASTSLRLEADGKQVRENASSSGLSRRIIVHVRDLKDICGSQKGDSIIRDLVRVVQKRRRSGQEIIIVGTTAQDVGGGRFGSFEPRLDEFRTVTVPPYFNMPKDEINQLKTEDLIKDSGDIPTYRRILEINLRHIQSMLQRLRPADSFDLFSAQSQSQLRLAGNELLGQTVLPFDQVQRLVLTAIGLSQTHAQSDVVNASHIGLAVFVAGRADRAHRAWSDHNLQQSATAEADVLKESSHNAEADKGNGKIEKLKKGCNQHETKLLPGVVDPQNIKIGFNEVHAPPETIDALKTLTSLSLLRPDAFKYGVLAADRLPGLILYGPPGTGKTLLAKAVAKESRATVLEISGAQIYEKYVGEGEKMVRAVFSLAKKLSPCIVFIDEADAIFGSRSSAGSRNTHREIINQFLREWDGMDLHNVFIMVASNRPFDMDDAVLRRLPRRLLVDLPVAKDREAILKIHLKEEQLDAAVDLGKLAEDTPLYSGSDLKNLCVAAALACVREENELAASKQDDKAFKLPDRRILSSSHFEKALKEISASISEDMSSLTAIRKFDEQYGDRKGRRKKSSYGFGSADVGVDESAARVRQPTTTTTTPPPP
ncbi:hypothetical protein M409DRAFT_69570 [Zasmidium cellare ATCC 36951]|uniref:AAA+ ATPase domain-containing protein n=1 Tax=Zasmidium cellare ATCC 36951 TaxID=1080233 RepID=A0A6A6C8K9_ZASCE|nr:uncharacterized protein M409DRAFT_69570 [Zasmidium cellare ATCC 36951]KAF2161766.1 hypothetical protein M409DRAFT_69570 [Zasmidium cellare ATCC 36951]